MICKYIQGIEVIGFLGSMHKLIKKLKIFGTRILKTELCESIIKSFNGVDAEYLDQVHQNKLIQRVYDDSEIKKPNYQNTSVTSPQSDTSTNFNAINNKAAPRQTLNRSDYRNNPETEAQLTPKAANGFEISDDFIRTGLDESDGNEWITPDAINWQREEDSWDGNPPLTVAIELPPTQQESASIPDRLTRAERSIQIAIKIGEEFDWDKAGIQLLASIFERYWWSSTQAAMKRAIESGMTPKELALAEELRQIWYEHPEYWSTLNNFGEIQTRYSSISWPTALKLIRSFNGYPQIEEVEALLNECLDRWINSSSLQHSFRSFYMYALYRIGAYDDLAEQDGWVIFDHYPTDEEDNEFVDNLEHAKKIHRLGVYVDPQAERYSTRSWDGRLVLLNARHGHELYDEK